MLKSIKKYVVQHTNCYCIDIQYYNDYFCVFLCSVFDL